ncbi:MAG: hypothetical protein RLN70_07210 [Rhodospirillaceae bacterium]
MVMRTLNFGALLIFGLVLAIPSMGRPQQLPQASSDPLMGICSGFLAQSGQSVSGDTQKLCSCLTRETQGQLTRAEMQAYSQATASGRPPPERVMQKVMNIATQCLGEAR